MVFMMLEAVVSQPTVVRGSSAYLNLQPRCISDEVPTVRLFQTGLSSKQIFSNTEAFKVSPQKAFTKDCVLPTYAKSDKVNQSSSFKTDFKAIKKKISKAKGDGNIGSFFQDLHLMSRSVEKEQSDSDQDKLKDKTQPNITSLELSANNNKKVSDRRDEKLLDVLTEEEQKHRLACLLGKLEALRSHASALEQWNAPRLIKCHRKYQNSAKNLIHYAAFKSVDICDLHETMSSLGLANLEGIEAHTMASLTSVICAVRALIEVCSPSNVRTTRETIDNKILSDTAFSVRGSILQAPYDSIDEIPLTVQASKATLQQNAELLLGPKSSGRRAQIMVTLSEEAAENEALVLDLMRAGMNVARINCAHGNAEVWRKIIRTVKSCSQQLEQPCRVLMELAGPKLRTGPLLPGPHVQKIKPQRDGYGHVIIPSQVWIASPDMLAPKGKSPDAVLPVVGTKWLQSFQIGDVLKFKDARGKHRQLKVVDKFVGSSSVGYWAACYSTAYLESGTELELAKKKGRLSKGQVAALPCIEESVRIKVGDIVLITREPRVTALDELVQNEKSNSPIRIACGFAQLFDSVKPGEVIKFDDGRIEGVIRGVTLSEISVEITFAGVKGTRLGGEKSINVPQSNMNFKGLTVKDLVDLDFVAGHADMVGLSFVNDADDVWLLQDALKQRGADSLGIVLKIETKSGLEKLPLLILQGMQMSNPLGVMIARGDLAVECGWETLAEMQEQILRICEAAHIPSIWATQVLEQLTKSGLPTRPEITDAAMGGRAECIMLNKGLHIVKAVSTLDNILKGVAGETGKVHKILNLFSF